MARLYIKEYSRALAGKRVCVACRQGILWDHFDAIVTDLKFLCRQGIKTSLYHNIPNRFANQKTINKLEKRLPETRIVRVPADTDFYSYVLDNEAHVHKLIFVERKYLVDAQGHRINALTTRDTRRTLNAYGNLIANTNFKGALERICRKIEEGDYDRVHILPAGKNTIRNELFSIEGSGTLIANNFTESFTQVASAGEISLIEGILRLYRNQGFLKPRTRAYLQSHHANFYVTLIDGIVVGCVEKKIIDPQTVEIGALAISTRFRNQRVGLFTLRSFINEMTRTGYRRFISLTNNPKLKDLYLRLGFEEEKTGLFPARRHQSPGVALYLKTL